MLSLGQYLTLETVATNRERSAKLLNVIQSEAIRKWGEHGWIASLVRAYCEIESRETGEEVKPVQRRSQLTRSLTGGSTTLETFLRLSEAVGIDVELTVIRKQKLN